MSKYPPSHPLWVVNPEFDKLYVTNEKFDITRQPSAESLDSYSKIRQEYKINKLKEQQGMKEDLTVKRVRLLEKTARKKRKTKKEKKEEKKEDIDLSALYQRELTPTDPFHISHYILYEYSSGEFIPMETKLTEVFLYEIEGNIVVHDSPEAIMQRRRLEPEKFIEIPEEEDDNLSILKFLPSEKKLSLGEEEGGEEEMVEEEQIQEEQVEEEEEKDDFDYDEFEVPKDKKLPNQFNFNERSVLTKRIIMRNKTTQTISPLRKTIKGLVTQWKITDLYEYDWDLQQQEKERARKLKTMLIKKKEKKNLKVELTPAESIFDRLLLGTKLMERMVNQNMYEEYALDCHFYDDPADTYRILEGAVLPLWEFSYEESAGLTVTYISWHPKYQDMFAIAYGSFKFCAKQDFGLICVYSLKNPAYPDTVIRLRSGAMCCNFSSLKPNYMAVGMYDGTVSVHNLIEEDTVFSSNLDNKHVGPVWEIQWCSDPRDGKLSFLSVGLDGKVSKWLIMSTCLLHFHITTLYLETLKLNEDDKINEIMGVVLSLPATAQCLALHPENYEVFLVGSAEGDIYQCNASYSTTPSFKYLGHDMAINRVTYNSYISDIFLSCSDDWTIKIWETNRGEPLLVYDLECSVGDVQWSPFSSSTFAAITADGNIQIFDMNINKFDAVCVQTIFLFDQSSPTRLQFNQKLAIILVGDTKGKVLSVKISPNCRLQPKKSRRKRFTSEPVDQLKIEVMKLEKILAFAREPKQLTRPNNLDDPPADEDEGRKF